jgi:uncharacterized protein DUF6883
VTVNPVVADRVDEPVSAWSGVWIAEDIDLIGQGVRSGRWVDGSLGVVGAGLDGLALVSDPVGALLQYGVSWLIEHVRPLSRALDWLAGDRAAIVAQAQTWRNVAASVRAESAAVDRAVRADVRDWSGAAAVAYRRWVAARGRSLEALGAAADVMAAVVEGAGALIGTVRVMVRDAVATVVSRLVVYAAEVVGSLGLATPVVVEQVSALCAAWAARIAGWLRALIASLRKLMGLCARLAELIKSLNERLSSASRQEIASHISKAPNFASAELDPQKITEYAMNPNHPRGRDKYRVIHSVTGLGAGDGALIEEQIREGVRTGTPVTGRSDQFGQRWTVDVPLSGPKGTITVRTAWIVEVGSSRPRLVTVSFPKQAP